MTDTAPPAPTPAPRPLVLGDDWSPAEPGVERKLVALGETMMAMRVRFAAGAAGSRHAHPHEQLTHVLSGRFRFVLGDTPHEVHAGESLSIPGGLPHEAHALEGGELLDVFSPPRADLLGG